MNSQRLWRHTAPTPGVRIDRQIGELYLAVNPLYGALGNQFDDEWRALRLPTGTRPNHELITDEGWISVIASLHAASVTKT